MTIHLCGLPEGVPNSERTGRPNPLLDLAPNGGTEPPRSLRTLVRSYRTVSTLPVTVNGPSAVYFLLLPTSGRPDLALASALPCGVPTFLDAEHRDHLTNSPSDSVYAASAVGGIPVDQGVQTGCF